MLTDVVLLLFLIVLNGLFAMSELAIVSSRRARLQQMAEAGRPGAVRALELAGDPTRFLSTIQVGITTIGVMLGAIGEAGIARPLEDRLERVALLAPYAEQIALLAMVVGITYLSLIVGELVPKRLAMLRPELIAVRVARPMHRLSVLARPVVKLLGHSTELVLRLLGARPPSEPSVSEEEIKILMQQGAAEGVFERVEQELVENILFLDTRRVGAIMTPRIDVVFVDLRDSFLESRDRILANPHSEIPVCDGGLENLVGVVRSKDLLKRLLQGQPPELAALAEPPLFVPRNLTLIQLLAQFKRTHLHTALAVDEYGEVVGLVSLNDVLEAIVGDLPSGAEGEEAEAVQRADGSWLVDGMMSLHDLKQRLDLDHLPGEEAGQVETVNGYVMLVLGRVPSVTDAFEADGARFEVVDMDGHRVDKVLVTPAPAAPAAASPAESGAGGPV